MTHYRFDQVIGNPPYNEDFNRGNNKTFARSIYHHFINLSKRVGGQSLLVTPARFLFNAGSTPKQWNHQMLNDPHLSVLDYYARSTDIFPLDIKAGISITSYNNRKINPNEPIKVFIPEPTLKTIYQKVACKTSESFSSVISARASYHLSGLALSEHAEIKGIVSKNTERIVGSNAFDMLENIIYFETKPNDTHEYVQLLGLYNRQRRYFWIRSDYLQPPKSFTQWKVFIGRATDANGFGKVISTPVLGEPFTGATDTFLSIGGFDTREEAENCLKYVKTKFARVLLGILKVLQDNTRNKWRYVPLQDFTSNSLIQWKASISHIDQQLYTYYGLTEEEQQFIESHVKEMD